MAVVLATGESRRLGRPKQLLEFHGQTLLHLAVASALNSRCEETIVVLGAHAEACRREIAELPVVIEKCSHCKNAIRASLRVVFEAVKTVPGAGAALITLVDQPLVISETIDSLIEAYRQSQSWLVASEYNGILGAPALFERRLYSELQSQTGDSGARNVILSHLSKASSVPLAKTMIDINTDADYERALSECSENTC
ncbi:MAG: NTP transferase domain-containing protein [Candidatus Zixiibacteriota bacterium]